MGTRLNLEAIKSAEELKGKPLTDAEKHLIDFFYYDADYEMYINDSGNLAFKRIQHV